AACWLAYHDRARLLERYAGATKIQWVFLHLLRATAARHQPPGWDAANFGAGILNVRDLLAEPLPPPGGGFEAVVGRGEQGYAALLAAVAGPAVLTRLVAPLGPAAVESFGAELLDLLYRRPEADSGPEAGFESITDIEFRVSLRAISSARL